jgi:quercetin dioxygenase-like cupin family protein
MTVPVITALTSLDPQQVRALPWSACPGWPGVEQKLLSSRPGLVVGLLRLAPGARELPHVHGNGEHHLWVLDGSVRSQEGLLPKGSYLHVRTGTLHQLSDIGGGSTLLFVFHEVSA